MNCTTEIKISHISVLVFWHDHCENSRTFVKEHILSRFEITGVVYEQKHILTLYVKVPGSVLCCLYFLSSSLIMSTIIFVVIVAQKYPQSSAHQLNLY